MSKKAWVIIVAAGQAALEAIRIILTRRKG